MREILSVKYKQSSLIFVLSFNLLLITVINFNTKIVFAGNIYLDPNFDKSYLNKTFSTEKVNAQVDCTHKCRIIHKSSKVNENPESAYCDSGRGISCCSQQLTLHNKTYDHISYWVGGKVYEWCCAAWYTVTISAACTPDAGAGYCYAGDNRCFMATHAYYYYLTYYRFSCIVDGNTVSRSTGWKADRSNSSEGERNSAAHELCNNDTNVKAAQNACLTECKRKNDEVRIKLGSKTIETVKDVLDTLTTEQIFYYLPHDSINYLYDPNQIYN